MGKSKKDLGDSLKDYYASQRAVDVLSRKINLNEMVGQPVTLTSEEVSDVKSLLLMHGILKAKTFNLWVKEGTKLVVKAKPPPKPVPKKPHPSHSMTRWKPEAIAPAGTLRMYSVRHCRKCGEEEARHNAGHFMNGLQSPCRRK